MPEMHRGGSKKIQTVDPNGYPRAPILRKKRDEPQVPRVRPGPDRGRGEQNEQTEPSSHEGPEDQRLVTFKSYTPLDTSKLPNVLVPVDPSGAAAENGAVVMTGNVYLAVSKDDGASFDYFDPSTMFAKFAGGIFGDQQIIYVREEDRFVWCMLHHPDPTTGDGAFRLAFAPSADPLPNRRQAGRTSSSLPAISASAAPTSISRT
jgi:hypothetical protein